MALGGGKQLPWRLVVGVALTMAFACGFQSGLFGARFVDRAYLPILVGQVICTAAVLLGMRLAGLRIANADDRTERSGPFQFSLADILNWTTATAVLLAFFKCLPKTAVELVPPEDWDIFCVVNAACGLLALASIWLVFGRRWLALRCLACPIVVFLDANVLHQVLTASHTLEYFLFAAHAGWLIASLLAIRLAGFRLAWRWRFAK